MVGVQYGRVATKDNPCHYDGVSEWRCETTNCAQPRIGRWSDKELVGDEHEPPFGEEHRKNCPLNAQE
jgi:hypothetical protein